MSLTTAIHAPRGRDIACNRWRQQAALRMIHNNLDPEVADTGYEQAIRFAQEHKLKRPMEQAER